MFKLSYSANSLTTLDFFKAIDEVDNANYDGIELFFEKKNFNPYEMCEIDFVKIGRYFQHKRINPVAISTATVCFLSDIPHEPSLITIDKIKRQHRIDLIKKGIEIAKRLNIPIVSFQSGYLRREHIESRIDVNILLINSIKECLKHAEDIILVIEPEPGMFIETFDDAINLIKQINSDNFKLHIDICHAYCTENNYVKAIKDALPYTAYMHLADIKKGYNLKLISLERDDQRLDVDLQKAGYLIYNRSIDIFLFIDNENSICFHFNLLDDDKKNLIKHFASKFIPHKSIDYQLIDSKKCQPRNAFSSTELENKAFLDSVGGISFDVLEKARSILRALRVTESNKSSIINKPICNTIQGKVHYHEIPGEGEIDFKKVLQVIKRDYSGYVTLELYNHSNVWETVLPETKNYLLKCIEYGE